MDGAPNPGTMLPAVLFLPVVSAVRTVTLLFLGTSKWLEGKEIQQSQDIGQPDIWKLNGW